MAGDPTPMEYDDPIEHVEWGAALASGEAARMLDEATARLVCEKHPGATLVRRTVVYHPWTVTR
jgi:hypothetical protein